MALHDPASRRLLDELARLDKMLAENVERSRQMRARIKELTRKVRAGETLPDVVAAEDRPLITEMITANIAALHEIGADFRRAHVAALRAQGLTMEQIADLIGVTRQRISAILKTDTGT